MKTLFNPLPCLGFFLLLFSCEGEAPVLRISKEERTWIPYLNYQEIQFQNSFNEIVTLKTDIQHTEISRSGKTLSSTYREEQIALYLYSIAPHANSLALALRPSKILIGASFGQNGFNTQALIKKDLTGDYQVEEDKYNKYSYLPEVTLNGTRYKDVIYRQNHEDYTGNNYFPEYYYAKDKGLIGLKLTNRNDWFYLKP